MLLSVPGVLADNALDVLSIVSYAKYGELWFCLGTFLAVAVPHLQDPFQGQAFLAAMGVWKRGFPSREWLEHQRREGSMEAPIGGFIALYSFLIARPGTLQWGITTNICNHCL